MTTPNTPITPEPTTPPQKSSGITMGVPQLFGLFFGFILILSVAFWLGGRGNKNNLENYRNEVNAYRDTAVTPALRISDSLREENGKLKIVVDSSRAEASKKTQQIKILQSNVAQLTTQNKKLADSVLNDATLPYACDQCRRALSAARFEVDTLVLLTGLYRSRDLDKENQIRNLDSALHNSQVDADTLRTILINFPAPPKPKRILGIRLPRIPGEVVFAAGVLTGIVIVKK